MSTKKLIKDYRVTYHGMEHSQYFQGHGVAFSKFTDCATGIGSSELDALNDALEQLVCGDWDVAHIETELKDEMTNLEKLQDAQVSKIAEIVHTDCDAIDECDHEQDIYYHVSVDVLGEDHD